MHTLNQLSVSDVIVIVIFAIVFCFGTIGNSLVIYVFGYTIKKPLSKQDILVLLLGIVDLIASITNPFLFIYLTFSGYQRCMFGNVACKALILTGPIATNFSGVIIVIMAVFRDRSIVSPFKKDFQTRTLYKAVVLALILSVLFNFQYIWFLKIESDGQIKITRDQEYTIPSIILFLVSDLLMFIICTVTTVRIFSKIKMKRKDMDVLCSDDASREIRAKRSKKAIRLIVVMEIVLILCVFPRDIFHVTYDFSRLVPPKIKETYAIQILNACLKSLHTANSCTNVLIYSAMNNKFRKGLAHLFRCFAPICRCFAPIGSRNDTEKSDSWIHMKSIKK